MSDINWMKARQHYLTASGVRSLKGEFDKASKAGIAGEKILPGFAALWCHQNSELTEEQLARKCVSHSDMARGHIMEPYAVKTWNTLPGDYTKMYHWDDTVIVNNVEGVAIGFSPDAMNVSQETDDVLLDVCESTLQTPDGIVVCDTPTEIVEIKSYDLKHHFKCMSQCLTGAMTDEAWQVGFAMIVCPTIRKAHCFYYNPSAGDYQTGIRTYTREELEGPVLSKLRAILQCYKKQVELLESWKSPVKSVLTEREIWEKELGDIFA